MSANEIQPYNYGSDVRNEFERKGHPGKYYKVITCTSGTTNFTGSNFGLGGILVCTGTTGTAFFSDGGSIPLAALSSSNATTTYEFSLSSVNVTAGTVYALIRNQIIR
jgi:hypothetical protein